MTPPPKLMYARTFEISACHFNGTATYDRYQEALAGGPSAAKLLRAVLADCHGHNFVIDVTVRGHAVQRTGELHAYLVSDAELEQVVRDALPKAAKRPERSPDLPPGFQPA